MYMSNIPARASRTREYPVQTDDIEEMPDDYYPQRMPTSTRRYVDTRGNQVIQRGNKRIVIHEEPPPKKRSHWMHYIGMGMIAMLALYVGFQMLGNWWTEHQLDANYGFPRTYQTDAIVYPGDTSDHPSHYIFLNLSGTVEIIELPHGDSAHARIYKGPTLFSDQAALIPVMGEFKNVNGKVEMLIHIQNQVIIYINDGTQFKPQ
jgi:hypothetical protein